MAGLVFILNGPNLNLLGVREPELYGTDTLADLQERCESTAADLELEVVFRQTNHEGVLVDWIHEARAEGAAIIINPAAFSFTSMAVVDALKTVKQPVVEVHITNIHRRGEQYRKSLVSLAATGVICGLGHQGYELALQAVASLAEAEPG